ncbi:MAG: hypothetical protein LBO73_02690 [Holosporaceae bacterium]|nr:hypothetical protein [Holosporaceae bacterium]
MCGINNEISGLSQVTEQELHNDAEADKKLLLYRLYSENDNYTSDKGLESWLRDAKNLASENFIAKIRESNCSNLTKVKKDFDLWCEVTTISRVFYDSWSENASAIAGSVLESMLAAYSKESGEYFQKRKERIKYLIQLSAPGYTAF